MKIEGLLFDLDGTLADTGLDLANALNLLLSEKDKAELPYENIRPFVSKGSPGLIQLGFGLDTDHCDYPPLKDRLLEIYLQNVCVHTRLFSGMNTLLNALEEKNIPWGIVTNKPEFLTTPLIKAMKLDSRAGVVISGDTYEHRKPHPLPIQKACELIQAPPENCLYFGDDLRDILSANSAGLISVGALWGYIPENEDPLTWPADHFIEKSDDIIRFYFELQER